MHTQQSKKQEVLRRALERCFSPLRRSLALRTIVLSVLAALLTTSITGFFILTSVSEDLTSSRLHSALTDSARATLVAQQIIDVSDASDRASLSNLMVAVRSKIRDTSASSLIYMRRQPGQPYAPEAPLDFRTGPGVLESLTSDLSSAVAADNSAQKWQYVTLKAAGEDKDATPGIIVGTSLSFPDRSGVYNLFIGYSFSDTEASVQFMYRALALASVVLIITIAGISLLTVSRIFKPIRLTAAVSKRLAAGDTNAKLPHQHDIYFDQLADSFNDMANTLNARIDELNTLSNMQQRFVSDVSHELRTPLTTIRLAGDVLTSNSTELPPAKQRAAEVLTAQIGRFEQLLADLLEISRYDAGQVQLETEPVSLIDLTTEIIEQLQPLSESLIELRALGGYGTIHADRRRIRRILSNLIGNAIEHGEAKPIVVSIDSNQEAFAVAVRDYGVGMTSEQVAHVFDRFWRADPSRKRTLGGTGLGLAISQEDAAVHGGLIEVWSRPQAGSNFRLTLPRDNSATAFLSPLPLAPADAQAADTAAHTGWVKRPRRWLLGKDSRG